MLSQILVLIALLVLSAFFSGSETSLVSVTNSKVSELVSKGIKNAKLLQKLKKDPHKLLITVLIGSNVANTGASALAAVVLTDVFGSSGVGIATGIMSFMILIFTDMTPKSFAHQHASTIALVVARPIYLFQLILFPFVWFCEKIVVLFNKLMGSKKVYSVTEGELVAMLKIGAEEGAIEKHEREFIENVLEFNDIEVSEVMTPRVAIEAVDSETTIQDAVEFVKKHPHSRIPVYKENVDNIIGLISVKDLLKSYDEYSPRKRLKTLKLIHPIEVPTSKKIYKLFREFQRKHVHMAIVIDEFGGTAGIVTLEDILEEIVGEIADEFDTAEIPIEVINDKTIIAKGDMTIEDINDFFKIKFAQNEHDTINTFLVEHLHRFPREGEIVKLPRAKILILKMKKKMVDKVKITKVEPKDVRGA